MRLFNALVKDESGGEVIEYALLLGLIVVACIATMSALGSRVLGKWQSIFDSM